jgi:hypothetical protein
MSLTSYRAAPPRVRRSDQRPGLASRSEANRDRDGAAGVFCPLTSVFWTSDQTWRRPALPPLRGQYPGRGAVSRPSSEWGRVEPTRCGHQVETEVRRTDVRGQMSGGGGGSRAGRAFLSVWSVKLLGMGFRGQSPDCRDRKATAPRPGTATFCHLSSVLWSEVRRARAQAGRRPTA